MVLKKLGDVLVPEFLAVVSYLALERRMNVVVEPALYQEMFHGGGDGRAAAEGMQFQPQLADHVYTWHPEDSGRCGKGGGGAEGECGAIITSRSTLTTAEPPDATVLST